MSRSIIPEDEPGKCYICTHYGKPPEALREERKHGENAAIPQQIEEHHIFGGPLRKLSEHYGLKVHLCIYHHREGADAVHCNRIWDLIMKRTGQQAFESAYGHGQWMQEFERDYLGESQGGRENGRKKEKMTEWCASDCGNTKCRYNAVACREPDKERRYVYIKGNIRRGCDGYKPIRHTEKPVKKAEKAVQTKKAGRAAQKTGKTAERKKKGQKSGIKKGGQRATGGRISADQSKNRRSRTGTASVLGIRGKEN